MVMDARPKLSVVIPTIDETLSLEETLSFLLHCPDVDILEVLLIVAPHTSRATMAMCESFRARHPDRVRIIPQHAPFLGGAFRTGVTLAHGTHIVLMFADLESDPRLVPSMAAIAQAEPRTIVSASRWIRKSSFSGYGPIKLLLNYCFQKACALASNSTVTDFTYGFRLHPSHVLQHAAWRETGHAFVLESILEPLLWKVPIREVPANWVARREGVKHNRFSAYSRYLITFLRIISRRWPIEHQTFPIQSGSLHERPLPATL